MFPAPRSCSGRRADHSKVYIVSDAAENADPLVRAERLRRPGKAGVERAAALAQGLEDDDLLVRGIAVLSLLNESPDSVLSVLAPDAPARGDGAWTSARRFLAVEHLARALDAGEDAPVTAWPVEEWARTEQDPALRSRVAAICGRSSHDMSLIQSLARDHHWMVRARLAVALASRPGEADLAAVLQLLARDPHATVRRAAMSKGPATS